MGNNLPEDVSLGWVRGRLMRLASLKQDRVSLTLFPHGNCMLRVGSRHLNGKHPERMLTHAIIEAANFDPEETVDSEPAHRVSPSAIGVLLLLMAVSATLGHALAHQHYGWAGVFSLIVLFAIWFFSRCVGEGAE